MSVSPISTSSGSLYPTQVAGAFKQREQDFTALGTSLQAGNLVGAQQAFAALKKDTQTIQSAQRQQIQPSGLISRLRPNFSHVERALNAGDLLGAQKAFDTVQQEIQAARKHHGGQGTTQNDSDGANGGISSSSTQSVGTNTNQSA
jgi:hypothetical protein